MDRDEKESLSKMQISFSTYVVEPLCTKLVQFLPSAEQALKNLLRNRKTWEEFLANAEEANEE